MIRSNRRSRFAGVLLLTLLAACSDDIAKAPVIASVQLGTAGPLDLTVGQTQQLTARAIDTGGDIIPTVIFNWSSSNGDVASVSPTGLVRALEVGSARVTVSAAGRSAGIDVNVTAAAEAATIE